jgi:beta-phosphoglucomutase-like phosphatase (HAD superfamily)
VQRTLGPSGILPRFDAIVAAGDYPRGKPNPDPFLTAASRLGVAPRDCLALEDSHNGIRAAHAAGMMTVMVPDLLEATDEMHEKALAIVESLHHVLDLIDREGLAAAPSGL